MSPWVSFEGLKYVQGGDIRLPPVSSKGTHASQSQVLRHWMWLASTGRTWRKLQVSFLLSRS